MKARFSAPVQTDPGAHLAAYTMGTGSFPVVKWPRRGVDHPPPSNAEVEGRVELYLYYFVACSMLNFTFILPLTILQYYNLQHLNISTHQPTY